MNESLCSNRGRRYFDRLQKLSNNQNNGFLAANLLQEGEDSPIGRKGHDDDILGPILMDFLGKERTISGQYYSEVLEGFDKKSKETRLHLAKEKVLFHHDNVPGHSSGVVASTLHEWLLDPSYSPDLTLCNYFFFPNMKKWLTVKKNCPSEEIIIETETYFGKFDKS